jgi:transposase
VLEETHDREEIIHRVAALDIGKAELVCCVRVPSPDAPGRRLQEVRTHATMTRSLLAMSDRLRQLGVTRVVMEATSEYWKPAFYLLEGHGFETWLVNARDVKHRRGGPRPTAWARCGLPRWSSGRCCAPAPCPPEIRWLRDLTRYRADLVAARTAEKNRVEQAA